MTDFCSRCGKDLPAKPFPPHKGYGNGLFCSQKCADVVKRDYQILRGEIEPAPQENQLMMCFRRMKNYAQRSSNYLAMGNTVLLVYIAFRNSTGLGFAALALITTLVVCCVVFVIGYLDFRLGFLESDVAYHEKYNPYTKEIFAKLDRIEKELREKK